MQEIKQMTGSVYPAFPYYSTWEFSGSVMAVLSVSLLDLFVAHLSSTGGKLLSSLEMHWGSCFFIQKLLASVLLPVSFTVGVPKFCCCIDDHLWRNWSPIAHGERNTKDNKFCYIVLFMANRTCLFDAYLFIEAQQRTFLKLQGKESTPWTKEIVEEAFSVVRRVMLILWLRWNGT